MVSSSLHYTKGTQCMESGKYSEAVAELEEAVRLDPEMGRNHTNLACAYMLTGDHEKSWIHYRKAVHCKTPCKETLKNFPVICEQKLAKNNLKQPGTSYSQIVQALGEPDLIYYDKNNKVACCMYGTFVFNFEEEKVVSTKYIL